MRDFSRIFVVTDGGCAGWTDSDRTSFVISVNYDALDVTIKSGRDAFASEINTAFGLFLEEYEAEFGEKIPVYERESRYRFCYRQGSSGCQDTFIEIDRGDGFPDRKFLMHESCYGKSAGIHCFVYDFLDLCVAGGFFTVEDGCYKYPKESDAAASDCNMKVFRPRLLKYEEGWTNPGERPSGVVYLRTCREVPAEPDENGEDGEEMT